MCIYKLTNLINKKIYIGRTIDYIKRVQQHSNPKISKFPIQKAILKYGKENFAFEILEVVYNEGEFITKYKTAQIAASAIGCQIQAMRNVLNKKNNFNSIKGFMFKYEFDKSDIFMRGFRRKNKKSLTMRLTD